MKKIILFCFLLSAIACTGGKKTVQNKSTLKKRSPAELFTELRKNNVEYKWYSAKGRLAINVDGTTQTVDLKLRMRQDSTIWLAVSMIGIEGGRALLTPDSITILNRLNATYLVQPYSYFQKKYNIPLSFQSLQEMLIGNAPDRNDIGWRSDRDSTHYLLTKTLDAEQLDYHLSGTTFFLTHLELVNLRMQQYFKLENSDFQPVNGKNLPFVRTMQVKSADLQQPLLVGIEFSKVELPETAPSMQLVIPADYRRTKEP